MEPADFQTWLAGGPAPVSPVAAGQKLFTRAQLRDLPPRRLARAAARVLDGLAGSTVKLQGGGTIVADEAYLRESILTPAAKIVDGYQPIMPTYQGQVSEEDVLAADRLHPVLPAAAGDAASRASAGPAGRN